MEKYVIDTNFLARLVIKDSPAQLQKVLVFIDSALDGNWELLVDASVIFELIYVLSGKIYTLKRAEVFEKITALLELNLFTFENQELIEKSLLLYKDHGLDIVDCYLIQKAVAGDYKFQSFDQKATKVYQKLQKLN